MVGDQEARARIDVRIAHEEVIVFEAERPILREGLFDTDANRGVHHDTAEMSPSNPVSRVSRTIEAPSIEGAGS
jgi:hypothetical protein